MSDKKVYNAVVLLDGRIYSWKSTIDGNEESIGRHLNNRYFPNYGPTTPGVKVVTSTTRSFEDAEAWRRQWPIHENHTGVPAY